jgi:hypothetical protein
MFGAVAGYKPADSREQRSYIRSRLLDAFRSGRLVLIQSIVERATSGGSSPASQPPPRPSPPAPTGRGGGAGSSSRSTKTWIEFQLLDNDDRPIPNERYKVKLTDGSIKDGHLGADGSVRFSGIDPGSCEISFPDLDTKDWAAA